MDKELNKVAGILRKIRNIATTLLEILGMVTGQESRKRKRRRKRKDAPEDETRKEG